MPVLNTAPPSDLNPSQPTPGPASAPDPVAVGAQDGANGLYLSQQLTIPAVHLEADDISSAMAARLASSLVSHVLFLKSQIPFPVVQLTRMPGSKTDTPSAKKKTELLTAIDTLSSHLHTTFRALSTAFAKSHLEACEHGDLGVPPSAQAHMAIVLGPTVGAPKARVMLVLSGLEVKHAGEASSSHSKVANPSQLHSQVGSNPVKNHLPADNASATDEDSSDSDSDETDNNSDYAADKESSDESPATPPRSDSSRSASPTHSESETTRLQFPDPTTFPEEQQTLRAADRLLSRTLASACAEPDGGLSCELSPTQTHILLRAPRHFNHPAWTPRQNITRSFEKTLQTFLNGAIADPEQSNKLNKPRYTAGPRTEGVWIGSRGEKLSVDQGDTGISEDGDMIWWTWNGKIVGFMDW